MVGMKGLAILSRALDHKRIAEVAQVHDIPLRGAMDHNKRITIPERGAVHGEVIAAGGHSRSVEDPSEWGDPALAQGRFHKGYRMQAAPRPLRRIVAVAGAQPGNRIRQAAAHDVIPSL